VSDARPRTDAGSPGVTTPTKHCARIAACADAATALVDRRSGMFCRAFARAACSRAGAASPLGRSGMALRWLSECECVGLGASLDERDLQRALADRVVLAHELVQAAVAEQSVTVLVDVHAV
jgi:hypothetical protein